MKLGYCRVNTREQNLDLQIEALKKEGCEVIYKDQVSSIKANRPQLSKLLENLKTGDTLVVWKLDRLGRSLADIVKLVNGLNEKKIELRSLSDHIDTTASQGAGVFNTFASLAELERDILKEKTVTELDNTKTRSKARGRPKGLSREAENKAIAAEMFYKIGKLSTRQIAKRLKISTSTLYEYLRYRGMNI